MRGDLVQAACRIVPCSGRNHGEYGAAFKGISRVFSIGAKDHPFLLPYWCLSFDEHGVWVSDYRCAIPVAIALRQSLISLSAARHAGEGQQTKMELVYQYLTGPRFRHRIEAIVEKFSDMQSDLEKERKATIRLWAKRETQIRGVIESTVGMYGDLQGIAGKLGFSGLDLGKLAEGRLAQFGGPLMVHNLIKHG
jgi:hypothetical protein